ncbi:MAG: glutamate--tRNA ligase [Planctomycetota bacterium]|nr:glutamate--tRNA ligase [Planctomycetota bacterium]
MVRTRFAPSPTGYLHIGGVRTALFNWLYARRHGGAFVLRIDDTDRKRNLDETLGPILQGFRWLGLDWDEGPEIGGEFGPYFQSERGDRYAAAVERLLERGFAYRDYASAEELDAERAAAREAKADRFVYSRRFMAETDAECSRYEAEGRAGVVRLKMPRKGRCTFVDGIRGEVSVDWALEQDHVIRRADGSCLYHLASVVDDDAMAITHVIRAEEHLSNTPRQIFIADGLGFTPPTFAHLPFVAEPGSKTKLSKRKLAKYLKHPDFAKLNAHGTEILGVLGEPVDDEAFNPVLVEFYERIGFLPDALNNYLALLGWSLDDRREDFELSELVEHFDLSRVNRAAASFDPAKLTAFQQRRMDALGPEDKAERCRPFVEKKGWPTEILPRLLAAAGDRITVAGDVLRFDEFFIDDDVLTWDSKAFEKRVLRDDGAVDRLDRFRVRLAAIEPFDAARSEAELKAFLEEEGVKIGRLIHALRVATTGKGVGLGMFDALELLGRESCLRRIDRALARARQEA